MGQPRSNQHIWPRGEERLCQLNQRVSFLPYPVKQQWPWRPSKYVHRQHMCSKEHSRLRNWIRSFSNQVCPGRTFNQVKKQPYRFHILFPNCLLSTNIGTRWQLELSLNFLLKPANWNKHLHLSLSSQVFRDFEHVLVRMTTFFSSLIHTEENYVCSFNAYLKSLQSLFCS